MTVMTSRKRKSGDCRGRESSRHAGYQLAEACATTCAATPSASTPASRTEFGRRHVRVRGHAKVYCYLTFGVLALSIS
jgi:hypothetical protein